MGGHVLDAFTVDPDFAIIAEALEIFRARERATPAGGVAHALLQEFVFYHGSSALSTVHNSRFRIPDSRSLVSVDS
jgi:hypothetical protein